jgi:hypothetical protein
MPMRDVRATMVTVAALVAALLPGARPLAAQGARATLRGTVRTAGAPRPNVTVNVVNLDNQNERQAITETDGTWTIGGLLPGRYEIRIDESGFPPYRSGAITLAAGQQRIEDITLQAAATPPAPAPAPAQGGRATLRGTVRTAGVPRPNVTVNVVNLDNQNERQAITEADGTWTIGGLLPGRYEIRIDETGLTPYRSAAIALTGGQQRTEDIALIAAAPAATPPPPPAPPQRPAPPAPPPAQPNARASLRGTVKAAGVAAPSVTINVLNLETKNERQVITESDGTYSAGGLPPGRYQLHVEDKALAPYRSDTIALAPGQQATADISLSIAVADYIPSPDRWRLEFPVWQRYSPDVPGSHPYVDRSTLGPYKQSPLKGDYPVFGTQDVFVVLTGVLEAPFELRRLPTPSGVSQSRPGFDQFFGEPQQWSFVSEAVGSVEIFKGDTSFKPRTWAFRATPVFNLNYTNTKEYNIVNATPEEKATRRRTDIALQEAFGEVKLADVGSHYDFVSVRAGIQPFTSDFRGFLYRDTNLGVRLFGTFGRNRNQWNVAAFDQLQKETNSELNLFERRDQKVIIANFFRQDFLTEGYTISPSFAANFDKGEGFFYDENGFLVQPSPIGLIQPHEVKAYYAGLGGDGHWGPVNISHQFYQAFGTDELNGIAGKAVDINAQFAAAEVSVDHDWWRVKGSIVYASGDDDPDDDKAKGFDAIFDNPNVAGGPFSFWNREGIRLAQTSVGLVARSSVLPSLRSSKTEGQANFVNPGLLLYNAGLDVDLTEKLRLSANANFLQFMRTEPLSRVLFQSNIDKQIGMDYSVGVQWRPTLNDQIVVTAGASIFTPTAGFKNILTTDRLFAPFVVLTLRY